MKYSLLQCHVVISESFLFCYSEFQVLVFHTTMLIFWHEFNDYLKEGDGDRIFD